MREPKDKCWWGAGCVNDASPVLRGCGKSMEMVQADRIPTVETLGHNEDRMPPKTKEPNLLARSRGPRGFFCLQVFRRGPVNVAVITL